MEFPVFARDDHPPQSVHFTHNAVRFHKFNMRHMREVMRIASVPVHSCLDKRARAEYNYNSYGKRDNHKDQRGAG